MLIEVIKMQSDIVKNLNTSNVNVNQINILLLV